MTGILHDLAARLGGRPVPADLRAVLALPPDAGSPLRRMRFELVGPDDPMLTNSWLTDADRANPGLMANVAAIGEVLRHAVMVASDGADDNYFGYWLHPGEPATGAPAVVCLDSEGQFGTCRGTLIEAMISNWTSEDEEYAELARRFADAGVPVAVHYDDLAEPAVVTDPAALHGRLYRAERSRRGLPDF